MSLEVIGALGHTILAAIRPARWNFQQVKRNKLARDFWRAEFAEIGAKVLDSTKSGQNEMIRLRFDAEFSFQLDEIYLLTIFMHPHMGIDAKMIEICPKLSDFDDFLFFWKMICQKNISANLSAADRG